MNKRPSDRDDRREPEADAIVQKSHDVAANIKHAALDRVDTVKRSAQALRDDTSDRVRQLGATVHKIGEHFRVEDQQYIATKMTGASQHINKAADYVSSAELGALLSDARTIARGNPLAFLGGAFILGLGAGRFLKGTSLLAAQPTSGRRRTATEFSPADDDLDEDDADARISPAQKRSNKGQRPRTDTPARAHR